MATLTIPTMAAPGENIDVDGAGFDPSAKFSLETVDGNGIAVGQSSNTNRPRKDGTFKVGILTPPAEGNAKVRAYQRNVVVAEASVAVERKVLPSAPLNLTGTAGDATVTLNWTAPMTGAPIISYKIYRDGGLVSTTPTLTVAMGGLANGRTFKFTVSALNGAGDGPQTVALSLTPKAAATSLAISNVVVSGITSDTAIISWDVSAPATGQVKFGPTSAYGSLSTLEPSFTYTHHVQSITGLTSATTYHFAIMCGDVAGNKVTSLDMLFVASGSVSPPPPPPPPSGMKV